MARSQMLIRTTVTSFTLAALLSLPVAAQHMGGATGQGHQHGTSPATAGAGMGQHGGGIDQMMQNSDAMMRSAEVMMRDLTAMPMAGQHGTLLTGMNGMLGQMRSMHGGLTTMMQDPAVMQNAGAMRAFNQASKNLEQMATAFNAMAKNMTSAMKGLPHGAR